MNEMAYVLSAWLPIIVWPQVEAPQYQRGYIIVSCLSCLLIAMTFVTRWLQKRDLKRCVNSHFSTSPNLLLIQISLLESSS